ncbi:helix-turn-helix domain-containing protein [Streptomyces sp. MI02-7b]|uniref:helix-turn-helix domain-containing protein n=1 Tax=Streptomyces sp. MI02-7b TaxID=462941 RepID=UPI0029AF28CF|nr:helix-turn-helix domain-containing protein [Streptomyces sp. MI02-7b]MDX3075803.1 helix-turn-helix domain-containing protein [Streptomyces sp. MI02-7b]
MPISPGAARGGQSALEPAPLLLPEGQQWLSTTSSRIAPDPYSWMQAVCWARLASAYRPVRDHGPKRIGETTLRVAAELARLSPCRPSVDHLVQALGLSRRTVQYHLGILRESGLLTYRSKGTRVAGIGGRASEFVWTIPEAFDTALGLITRPSDRYIRALTGVADSGRALMRRLARMARSLTRRGRRRRAPSRSAVRSSATSPCTPMEGGSSRLETAGTTSSPSESKLRQGKNTSRSPRKGGRRRPLNKVGRRYQLARELIARIAWLRGCSVPRIAWVIRSVADAGWSADEVCAWLHLRGEPNRVHRASGLLATLLDGVASILDTPSRRARAVERWHAALEAARRHAIVRVRDRGERFDGDWQMPSSLAVRRRVALAVMESAAAATGGGEELPALASPQDLTSEESQAMRRAAWAAFLSGDGSLVTSAVQILGRLAAEAVYGPELVHRTLQVSRATSLTTVGRGMSRSR